MPHLLRRRVRYPRRLVAVSVIVAALAAAPVSPQMTSLPPAQASAAPTAEVPTSGPWGVLARPAADRPAGARRALAASPPVASSSSSTTGSAAALTDGDVGRGQLGAEWQAEVSDASPWVQLTWSGARRLASVQVFGSSAGAFDPKQSTAAALYGTLRFSDGSSVVVAGVAPGAGMPTTVAFAPRSVSWVRFEIKKQIAWAPVALREFSAYTAGTTPPRWAPTSGASYSATPAVASCAASSPALPGGAAPTTTRLALACPTPGGSVTDSAVAVVTGPAGAVLSVGVSAVGPSAATSPLRPVATATIDASGGATGRATFTVDVRDLPQGPFALKVTGVRAAGVPGPSLAPLYVQLFRAAGATPARGTGSSAPAGMTLQYDEQFDGPLSITGNGWGAQYAAVKPEPWGGSQFGDAVFADPAWGAGTLATLPGGYLRLRAQPIGQYTRYQSWGQKHISGIVSSQRWGGSGFSAQYGYFEARILGAPGPGAWSAFWMMNADNATGRPRDSVGEVDVVELYGHDTRNACATSHAWGLPKQPGSAIACPNLAAGGDWAAQWHTYGAQIRPDGVDVYIDGLKVASLARPARADEPFFFMLDLATAGGWPVDLSATGQTTDMYVDWVRVYT